MKKSILPWLTFKDCAKAVNFYKTAFDATETYRLELPDGGLIVRLNIDEAEFWLASGKREDQSSGVKEYEAIRFILVVDDPETYFEKAIKAGASEVFPVGEGHGWKLGRIADPFGIHWEIGYELK